jgi:hypothetical protein
MSRRGWAQRLTRLREQLVVAADVDVPVKYQRQIDGQPLSDAQEGMPPARLSRVKHALPALGAHAAKERRQSCAPAQTDGFTGYAAAVDLNEPLPRLLRLRGMVARSVPSENAKVDPTDAAGLTDTYNRLRDAVNETAAQLGIDPEEFASELPPRAAASGRGAMMAQDMLRMASQAKSAATSLRALAGYVEGLIEAVVLEQKISMDQVKAAREAAKQPPGFR